MIRENSTWTNGVKVAHEVIDPDAGTITFYEKDVLKSTRALTDDEVDRYAPPPAAVDERLAKLEAENAALRKALVKGAVLTDAAIDAEKVAVAVEAEAVIKG